MSTRNRAIRLFQGAVLLVVFLFSSCLGIGVETAFNEDGSGRMTVEFRISQALLQMGEEESGVDIPLSKDDLMAEYEDAEGVTLIEVTEENTEEDRIVTAVMDFEDFNTLSDNDQFIGEKASLEIGADRTVLRMLIGQPNSEDKRPEMDDAMMAMVQSFMEGYSLEYRIVAPRKITSYSDGELLGDGKTLVYRLAMGDFIMIEEPFFLEIVW